MTEEQKAHFRQIKGVIGSVQDAARNAMVQGCKDQGAYIQFGRDMGTYNLCEAFMYAQSYEDSGMYAAGTTAKAIEAAYSSLKMPV